MKRLCILLGCSGINSDCPGNPDCEILRDIAITDPEICRKVFPDTLDSCTETLLDDLEKGVW